MLEDGDATELTVLTVVPLVLVTMAPASPPAPALPVVEVVFTEQAAALAPTKAKPRSNCEVFMFVAFRAPG